MTAVEDNEAQETSDSEPGYDIETYHHALEEGRRSWDQLLDAFNDIAEKSWRIIRLNGIAVTIYVAVVANAVTNLEIQPLTVGIMGIGILSLTISTIYALIIQQTELVSVGQGPEALQRVREQDPNEIEYLYETLRMYKEKIAQVADKVDQNGEYVNRALRSSLIGLGFLIVGTLLAIVL